MTVAVLLAAIPAPIAADDLGCRRAVGREGARYLSKAVSILRKCEERRISEPALVCPETRETLRLARRAERARLAINRECARTLPAQFAPSCSEPCTAAVVDADSLATCLLCLADAHATAFLQDAYPQPGAAVDTATPTPAATPTSTGVGAVCGNGTLEPGEQCDPPADTACPEQCASPGTGAACQCLPLQSCSQVAPAPSSCLSDADCPPPYTCAGGECRAGTCTVKADCLAEGQCVYAGSVTEGTCICNGCDPWDCTLGCELGFIYRGCRCNSIADCPPQDDVCFLGVCS